MPIFIDRLLSVSLDLKYTLARAETRRFWGLVEEIDGNHLLRDLYPECGPVGQMLNRFSRAERRG